MDRIFYTNPYTGADLISFFPIAFSRLWQMLSGSLQGPIASDEIQLLTLFGMALSCSLLGVFTVLRRTTMLANALSHTILLGIVLSFILLPSAANSLNLSVLFCAAIVTALITAIATHLLTTVFRVQQDASIGLVFTAFFALGIILITLYTRNTHISVDAVLGNVDALQYSDISLTWGFFAFNALIIIFFYKEFLVTTFDPAFSSTISISPSLYRYILMILTSFTVIGAFKAVGVLMVLAFLTGPTIIARLFTSKLSFLIAISMALASLCVLISVATTRHIYTVTGLAFSTSGITVAILALFFLFASIFKQLQKVSFLQQKTNKL